ncbi:AbrB/MazE/SpoVT family DNA-binding domain-containing protein [Bryobacter aggregatus]|uniref:AbrB/MazE/SpoVT family DNA-binding domain-containing protein n=1 Tax=Bryobacter aggregatus TaxID=360054 RepID=UPI0004E1205E|nr:AbrB/MazE/SpoVT family DNA-binding domain-containing protein [Bryobacter aggregatus]
MASQFLQMGKRGTVVIPAKLRRQLGMEDGCLLIVDEVEATLRLRLAKLHNPEPDARLKMASRLLSGAEDLGEYLAAIEEVRRMGFEPEDVPHERYSGS